MLSTWCSGGGEQKDGRSCGWAEKVFFFKEKKKDFSVWRLGPHGEIQLQSACTMAWKKEDLSAFPLMKNSTNGSWKNRILQQKVRNQYKSGKLHWYSSHLCNSHIVFGLINSRVHVKKNKLATWVIMAECLAELPHRNWLCFHCSVDRYKPCPAKSHLNQQAVTQVKDTNKVAWPTDACCLNQLKSFWKLWGVQRDQRGWVDGTY